MHTYIIETQSGSRYTLTPTVDAVGGPQRYEAVSGDRRGEVCPELVAVGKRMMIMSKDLTIMPMDKRFGQCAKVTYTSPVTGIFRAVGGVK